MLAPDELIGQKVWLEVERDPDYPDLRPYRIKAELTQPTSPPWFFARYEDAPFNVRSPGQWLTLNEAQQAYLLHPVLEFELEEAEGVDCEPSEEELEFS